MRQMLNRDAVPIQCKHYELTAVKLALQTIVLHGIRLAWLLLMLHKLSGLPRDPVLLLAEGELLSCSPFF